ncbi:MAG: 4'-phosphopantetheinyl transferase superfamily protein [Candidatus Sulfotelmatobacter sp.]
MNVYWLEHTKEDVPADDDWLSKDEADFVRGLRFANRRDDWRLGRWTAKHALTIFLNEPAHPLAFAKIEVHAASSGAPKAFFQKRPVAATISLSHRAGRAACTVAISGAEMGCDLELAEPRSDAFVSDYFTVEEQALIARASANDRERLLALLWSAKESALKALGEGLRLDTRCVVVHPFPSAYDFDGWSRLMVRYSGSERRLFHGWWQHAHNLVRTVVATPPPNSPIYLTIPPHGFDGIRCRCA